MPIPLNEEDPGQPTEHGFFNMTMPHLMNCPHEADGWCLDCVKELYDEKEKLVQQKAFDQRDRDFFNGDDVPSPVGKRDPRSYEIFYGRNDIPERVLRTFKADNDLDALQILDMERKKENLSWERLRLIEVVQERCTRQIKTLEPGDAGKPQRQEKKKS